MMELTPIRQAVWGVSMNSYLTAEYCRILLTRFAATLFAFSFSFLRLRQCAGIAVLSLVLQQLRLNWQED